MLRTGYLELSTLSTATGTATEYYASQFQANRGQMLTGTGKLLWQDGSLWCEHVVLNGTRNGTGTTTITTAPSQVTVFDYVNPSHKPLHLVLTGTTNVIFIDGGGHLSIGVFINPTQLATPAFPGDIAPISNSMRSISWTDGTIWTKTNVLPLMVTFTDTNGAVSHVRLTSATTLIGLDGALKGLTATRLNGKLSWSNGAVWDNLDFNGLNAVFEMGIGYP